MISMVPLEMLFGIDRAWNKCIFWNQAGVLCWNDDGQGGNGTGTGWCADFVLQEHAGYQDESHVIEDVRQELLEGTISLQVSLDDLAHHDFLSMRTTALHV